MSEKFKIHLRDKIDSTLLGNIDNEISTEGVVALHRHLDEYFDLWNVAPVYKHARSDEFPEMRKKLNTEAVYNHFKSPWLHRCSRYT